MLICKNMDHKEYNNFLQFGFVRKAKEKREARKDYEEITRTFQQILFLAVVVILVFFGIRLLYWIANVILPFWWLKI